MQDKVKPIRVGDRRVGPGHPCMIVAEIGPNHDGEMARAERLIELAAESGCDAVKFQYHIASEEIADKSSTIPWSGEVRYDFVRRVQEFTPAEHAHLRDKVHAAGMLYICSPFNMEAARELDRIGVDAYKIASGELSNIELIQYCVSTGRTVILSCGMSGLDEIDRTMEAVKGVNNGGDVMLLQCTSEYPTPSEHVNLRVIETLIQRYGVPSGLSDHCKEMITAIGSVCFGGSMIEKHFTDDRTRKGPDHFVSMEPAEMAEMVRNVRILEQAVGSGEKRVEEKAESARATFVNSVTLIEETEAGTVIERCHLKLKKPGSGIPPWEMDRVIGCTLKRNLPQDHILKWDDLMCVASNGRDRPTSLSNSEE